MSETNEMRVMRWVEQDLNELRWLNETNETNETRRDTRVPSRVRAHAAVGPEGIEPPPPRLRAGCASSCATDPCCFQTQTMSLERSGTRGGRTLIPRGKSPVLDRLS